MVMGTDELLKDLRRRMNNLRFAELVAVAEKVGFVLKGGQGSHRFFVLPGTPEVLNLQDHHGKAKPYQVRQLINVIRRRGLTA